MNINNCTECDSIMDCYDYCGERIQTYVKIYVGTNEYYTAEGTTLCGEEKLSYTTAGVGVVACQRETEAQYIFLVGT